MAIVGVLIIKIGVRLLLTLIRFESVYQKFLFSVLVKHVMQQGVLVACDKAHHTMYQRASQELKPFLSRTGL
jgi:glutathionyl-hydroquinone reductase